MATIEFTFLGTGTAVPTLRRNHPGVHLLHQSKTAHSMLFDCGEGAQIQLQKAKINFMSIDNIFISHWHADHFLGMFGLLMSMSFEKREKELLIAGPEADKIGPQLLKLFNFSFKINFVDSSKKGIVFEDEEIIVESMPVKHTIPAVAYRFKEKDKIKLDKKIIKKLKLTGQECKELKEKFRIKKDKTLVRKDGASFSKKMNELIKLKDVSYAIEGKKFVYSGDTIYLKKMENFCKDCILVHECTYFDRKDIKHKQHSCLQDVLKFRKSAEKIYLTHIGRKYLSQTELEKKVRKYKNVFVAKDLKKVKF
ncbi:MAG: ribonuclease Z [Candidatus Aenigmarchaeota archaeon]|nr:ribonuclease Z [Candidatus Aenigmarchaeota archaeon]